MEIPSTHPRIKSLKLRQKLVDGLRDGIVDHAGLIAHGRGEAFDYLLGEKTTDEAQKAIKAAIYALQHAANPVISVNGNSAALTSKEIIELSNILDAKIEVNLFHKSSEREKKIKQKLLDAGATKVYGVGVDASERIPALESNRRKVDPRGIHASDAILVMLEDGDRTEALTALGKKVLAIDLNPLSRTAQKADISIVDNISRALPELIKAAREKPKPTRYNNKKNLKQTIDKMRAGI